MNATNYIDKFKKLPIVYLGETPVDVAEWLRRTPAKCVGSPAQVRILPSTKAQ